MTPVTQKVSMGLSATVAFRINHDCFAPVGRLSITCSVFAPGDRISGDGQQPVPYAGTPLALH
jgi:hypothetical protein